MTENDGNDFRCGFVSVTGRPNVGKSTLINSIVGQELCIVTAKAQTTRNRITAIHSLPNSQTIFVDTPGIHEARTPLNRAMVDTAVHSVEQSDVVLFVTTPVAKIPDEEELILDLIRSNSAPVILAVNKIDTVKPKALLSVIETYSNEYDFHAIIPISAINGSGVPELEQTLIKLLPHSPPLFPDEDVSDLPLRFFVGEIVREMVTNMTGEEIPYKCAVVVESFKQSDRSVLIQADIHTERQTQKKILIGKGGSMIKRIGTASREKIEEFLGCPVRLELFVKVTPKWSKNAARLKEFGYVTD